MKILITGAAGMIGSHCAQYFAQKKNKIVAVDNLARSKIFGSRKKTIEYNWHYLKSLRNIKLIKQDIRDAVAIHRLFKKESPDGVIHAASQPGVTTSLRKPLEDFSINMAGTMNVLEAFRMVNKKGVFLYCSTNKVYGDNVNDLRIRTKKNRYEFMNIKGVSENHNIDLTSHTPYGVSKLAGDLYTQEYAHTYGLKTGIFRMSCIYGTRQFGFEDQGWLAWFFIRFLQGKPITIFGNGKQIRDILWIKDLVRAYEAFIKNPRSGEVFNIGGGHQRTISLLELIAYLKNVFRKSPQITFKHWRSADQKVYVSDISKAKKLLGWKPEVSVNDGLSRLHRWISENPDLF